MPQEAFAVHGLSSEFLADKPLFSAVAEDFLTFIGDAPLVMHNAIVRPRLHQCRADDASQGARFRATAWSIR